MLFIFLFNTFVYFFIFDEIKKKSMKKKILVTNDDSIHSPGLNLLVQIAKQFGDVKVIAPSTPQSGMGRAVTVNTHIRVIKSELFSDVDTYVCSGTPVDCVKWAIDQLYQNEKPDLLVSGINHGRNDGVNILYSGTMSAAMEGALENIPSIGFSFESHSWKVDIRPYQSYIKQIIKNTLKNSLPKFTCLNVNIPYIPIEKILGIKICRQARAFWKEEYEERIDPSGHSYYWLAGKFSSDESVEEENNSDFFNLKNGYISVVPACFDLTNYEAVLLLKNIEGYL